MYICMNDFMAKYFCNGPEPGGMGNIWGVARILTYYPMLQLCFYIRKHLHHLSTIVKVLYLRTSVLSSLINLIVDQAPFTVIL